ncbi:MAG: ABC transporter ATP-binding protein [Mesotoga sp.]|uniref:ABC transporter ATP-binding protein n=1 Tax=unclassified Mesotoga TaxID=1184398 RepID=UPI000EF27D0C|nr:MULTISPECIES: ABC transporter ATP-binding protein [unclassified Mesotoga]MDI9369206.1 ABC transporter ATP-binding protein [Thermotogota bacterium]NLT45764.1 ABC transporter ATP-binding protein [Thermotogaceae bacterium]MDD2334140.1 ABC transporter ATP-binding protein [Mesotoga sp.]MDD3679945.1 ABC transporter ATP-binding protein [Mesotoga sp.]MDD4206581.1 ABC transporter ATP-binding protein [Mesotoga sp.]
MRVEKEPLLEIKDLKIAFDSAEGMLYAVKGISLEVLEKEIVGIVGESGCGKTVTALSIMRLLPGNSRLKGSLFFSGTDLLSLNEEKTRQIRGKDISMIFQETLSSLNPLLKVGWQIDENLKMHTSLDKEERFSRVLEIMKGVGLPDPERTYGKYPHELSGGMRQRIAIAIAIVCNPKLIIADEPTTSLDVTIQAQILELLREINRERYSSIIFISHNLGVIREICSMVYVMYAGHIVEKAPVSKLFTDPAHPYTMGLMKAIPKRDSKGKELFDIRGRVPSIAESIPGCPFEPRCGYAVERCKKEFPEFKKMTNDHEARCFLAGDI